MHDLKYALKIDPEFKALIPPLSPEEFHQLEENITSTGKCRDAIITWNATIIDGHNRYAICQKHGIPYTISETRFPSRKEATLWILEHQLGRRNLTDAMRINLASQKIELIKILPKTGSINTRKEIATEAKVSGETVHKYMKIKELADQNLLSQVNNGELKIGTAYKMLSVSTKTVKELVTPEELEAFNCLCQTNAVLNTIGGVEKLYKFISKNMPIACEKDEMFLIQKRLTAQVRCLECDLFKAPGCSIIAARGMEKTAKGDFP